VPSFSISGVAAIEFLGRIAPQGDERPTVVILENVSIFHVIDPEVKEYRPREQRMKLFYTQRYSLEFNLNDID
jgi:hypothetical protein